MITEEDIKAFSEERSRESETHQTPLSMVEEYQGVTGQKPNPDLYSTLITEEYKEWRLASMPSALSWPEEELKELCDMVYVIYGYAHSKGWNMDEALKRVHKNNMGRMYQEDGTIQRREDGKVIKRPGYPKVDLGDLV